MQLDHLRNTRLENQPTAAPRRGMTLVEVMVVVTLTAVLLGVVISLAVGLQQWDNKFRDHGVRSNQTARLAETIRSDIRQATEVSLPAKETLIIVGRDQQQTRYELGTEGCQRIVKEHDGAEGRELFTIGPPGFWKVERDTTGRRPLTTLSLERPSADEPGTGLTQLLISATIGAEVPPTAETKLPAESKPEQEGTKP